MAGFSARGSYRIDMLNGPLLGKMVLFALPLAVSTVLQQLFNAADIAVVGRFASRQALAAVGSNNATINLLIGLFVGLSIGTNVCIAKYIGQGATDTPLALPKIIMPSTDFAKSCLPTSPRHLSLPLRTVTKWM